jgi:hypothetical protein
MLIVQKDHPSNVTYAAIDVSQWRFVRAIEDGKLSVVVFPLKWWTFSDISLDNFMLGYNSDSKYEVEYVDLVRENIIACPDCVGWGKIDWIDMARGGQPNRFLHLADRDTFEIDKIVHHWKMENTCFKGFTDISIPAEYITTKPKLDTTDRLCETCFGSGMHLRVDHGTCICMNSLGYWYRKARNESDDPTVF